MNRIAVYLNRFLDGVAYSAPHILNSVSTDRSPLRYTPRLLVEAESVADISRTVELAKRLAHKKIDLPVNIRGNGYGKNGGSLGRGVVISTCRMNRVEEIDEHQQLVRVQAGAKLGILREALRQFGLEINLVGNDEETIGGLLARNCLAQHRGESGRIADLVMQMEVVLPDGEIIQTNPLHIQRPSFRSKQNNKYYQLCQKLAAVLGEKKVDLKDLICGSEGSLAVITDVILCCEPIRQYDSGLVVTCAPERLHQVILQLKRQKAIQIEVFGGKLKDFGYSSGKDLRIKTARLSPEKCVITARIRTDSSYRQALKLSRIKRSLAPIAEVLVEDLSKRHKTDDIQSFVRARLSMNDVNCAQVLDGIFVPSEEITNFSHQIYALSQELNIDFIFHYLPEHDSVDIKPVINVDSPEGRKTLLRLIRKINSIVASYNGFVLSSAGVGRFRASMLDKVDSAEIQRQAKIKQTIDPYNVLGQGVRFGVDRRNTLRHFCIDKQKGVNELL